MTQGTKQAHVHADDAVSEQSEPQSPVRPTETSAMRRKIFGATRQSLYPSPVLGIDCRGSVQPRNALRSRRRPKPVTQRSTLKRNVRITKRRGFIDGQVQDCLATGRRHWCGVLEAAKIVLDRASSSTPSTLHGDIGWEFWCKEGDAFPRAPSTSSSNVDAAMFGAITSKPVKAAEAELAPGAAGHGPDLPFAHRAHAAAVRPLHLPAAVQGLPGQSAQLQGRPRPRRVPREHRGPLLRASSSRRCRPSCAAR